MEINIDKLPNDSGCLIPVADQLLPLGIRTGDIKYLNHKGARYLVFDYFDFDRDDYFPKALFFLATGKIIDPKAIWRHYSKSSRIFLFVCIKEKVKEKQPEPKQLIIDIPDL